MDEVYPWNLQPVDSDGLTVPHIYEILPNELEEDVEEFDSQSSGTETETTPSEDSSGISVLSADLF